MVVAFNYIEGHNPRKGPQATSDTQNDSFGPDNNLGRHRWLLVGAHATYTQTPQRRDVLGQFSSFAQLWTLATFMDAQ